MKNPGHQVIVGFKEGSITAFRTIYTRYYRALYNFVRQLTDDCQEAEDITAETFVKLWKLHDRFETEQNIKAFLFITARNASLNFLRYKKNQLESKKELFYLHDEEDNPTPGNEMPTELELLELIQSTLDELPYRQKEIMHLILIEGLNDFEVATRLNKNPRTIQNLRNIALKFMRATIYRKWLAASAFLINLLLQA